jgi:hypothetical protein
MPFGDRLMRFGVWLAGLVIIAGGLDAAAEPSATIQAVRPAGPGVLTICRSWLIARSCHHYHHIDLPARVAVGDSIPLSFGSSTKKYNFPVARIAVEDDRCTLFTVKAAKRQHGDKLEIAPCYPAE